MAITHDSYLEVHQGQEDDGLLPLGIAFQKVVPPPVTTAEAQRLLDEPRSATTAPRAAPALNP